MISKIYNFLQSVEEVSVVSLISLLQKWASISCSLEALLQARKKKKKKDEESFVGASGELACMRQCLLYSYITLIMIWTIVSF
jgi:hypothetical protein